MTDVDVEDFARELAAALDEPVYIPPEDADREMCCADHFYGDARRDVPCSREVCVACGHEACPSCRTWCDVLVSDPLDPDDIVPCCDGRCQYAPRFPAWAPLFMKPDFRRRPWYLWAPPLLVDS